MSTPIDIVMPYGVTVQGTGSGNPSIVGKHPKQTSNLTLGLPAGPCRVAASWAGTEDVSLRVRNEKVGGNRTIAALRKSTGGVRNGLCRGCGGRRGLLVGRDRNRRHRHDRGLPTRLNRVALRAGAVV